MNFRLLFYVIEHIVAFLNKKTNRKKIEIPYICNCLIFSEKTQTRWRQYPFLPKTKGNGFNQKNIKNNIKQDSL